MQILSYHPSVEAYVATDSGYLDLSEDITSCTIRREQDKPSGWTLRIQNRRQKYDNRISPMDRIVLFASKDESRVRLLTGYVTRVDRFKLFDEDMSLSGYDTLYRLQRLYFDPGLMSVSQLFSHSSSGDVDAWGGYVADLYRWLVDIGGWPEGQIDIGALPSGPIEWARDLYKKQLKDVEGSAQMAERLYEVLVSTGSVTASGGGGGPSAGLGAQTFSSTGPQYGAPAVTSARGGLSAEKRQIVVNAAFSILGAPYRLYGEDPVHGIDCSGLTQWAFRQIGKEITHSCARQQDMLVRVSEEDLQPGDLLVWVGNAGGSATGNHVAISLGGRRRIHANGTCVAVDEWGQQKGARNYPTGMGYIPE